MPRNGRINKARGNSQLLRTHPTGIKIRWEVHRDRISFAFHRTPLRAFAGCFELWRQQPPSGKRNAATRGRQRAEWAVPIHGDWQVQRAAISDDAHQQRRDMVHGYGGVDGQRADNSERLHWERHSLCHRRPERVCDVRADLARNWLHPGGRPAHRFDKPRRRASIQGIRIRNTDLPLSAIKIVRLFVRPVSQ